MEDPRVYADEMHRLSWPDYLERTQPGYLPPMTIPLKALVACAAIGGLIWAGILAMLLFAF